jgi:hypothetical protein
MELVSYEPETSPSILLPGTDEIIIVPIGDVQYGAPGCDMKRLKKHITWAEGLRERGHEVYYIGMGDYYDVMSPSNRKAMSRARVDLYDSALLTIDKGVKELEGHIERILEPTGGHWLGLLTGHHLYQYGNGETTDTHLADFLGTRLLGHCSLVHLVFKDKTSGARDAVGKIWCHHGQGSGTTLEGALRKVRANVVPYWFANAYLIGHYHQKAASPVPWIDTHISTRGKSAGKITWQSISRYIVSTGSFLKGYQEHSLDAFGRPAGDYVEIAMLPPNVLGGPIIFMRPRRIGNMMSVDCNVSL